MTYAELHAAVMSVPSVDWFKFDERLLDDDLEYGSLGTTMLPTGRKTGRIELRIDCVFRSIGGGIRGDFRADVKRAVLEMMAKSTTGPHDVQRDVIVSWI